MRASRRSVPTTIMLVLLTLLVAACSSPQPASERPPAHAPTTTTSRPTSTASVPGSSQPLPCNTATPAPRLYSHVVWIWMENHTWSSVIGNSGAPFLTRLAQQCATATNYANVGSPSLPNYLAATSGSTQGVSDDDDPSAHSFAVDNLFRQVRAAGGSERSFVESMPSPCDQVSAGSYAAKHNPAVYYDGSSDRAACQGDDLALSALPSWLASGTLPTFASITPNICDDMHDCSVTTGDQWLSIWIPRILATAAYRSGTTAVFIIWDEPTPVANVEIAPALHPGTRALRPVNHYSLLRATEEMLGLPLLGAAQSAVSLRSVFGM